MQLSEKLYQRYLEELQALETFKLSHTEDYFGILKEVMEDPHTKHLVESLAFLIARNQLQSERTINDLYHRLFRQYFPFLWSPLPSMGIVQFNPSRDLSEAVLCRKGTEVSLQTFEGRRAYFQTMEAVKVLPIFHSKYHFSSTKGKEAQFFLQFSASTTLDEEIGCFRLFVNYLNHFPTSFSLLMALRTHLRKVELSYDTDGFEGGHKIACPFTFDKEEDYSFFHHPIENLRSHLHLPDQELYIDIEVPPHTKRWQTFTLCFSLGHEWPKEFPLTKESFLPFTAPIINLQKKNADLIHHDGTKSTFPILHPNPDEKFSLHSVLGVYSIENHKAIPLKPGVLTDDGYSYEIEALFDQNHKAEFRLHLDLKKGVNSSKLISVEGFWYQPWFDKLEQDVKAIIVNQVLTQLKLNLVGKLCSPEDRAITYDTAFLTRLLSLKNQTRLNLDEILFLMNTLKAHKSTHFKEIPGLIRDLRVKQLHSSLTSAASHEYIFLLEKLDDKNLNLALLYFRHMKHFFDLWLPNIEVVITLNAPNFNVPVTIKEGTSHETSSLVRNLLLF